MKKRIFKIILSCLVLTFIYFLLDINDLPASIGIQSENINWDIASIIISNIVVVCLYLITFNELDHRSIEKDKNHREVALLLLSKTYGECRESVEVFDYPGAAKHAAEKCDLSKMIHEDKQLQYYLDFPFEFHEQIVEFASSGIISKKEFSDYLDLREAFRKHINIRIMSFDREELPNSTKNEFLETYERVTSFLNRGEK